LLLAGIGIVVVRLRRRHKSKDRNLGQQLVGDNLEPAIEIMLTRAGINCRKTKGVERIERFDQTPDFIIPSEFNLPIIIEAKITEDDGTARNKGPGI
jgi:hypothetical protein